MHMISYKEFLDGLKGRLKGRIVMLGIGNELMGDDAFGPYLVDRLKDKINATVFNCGTAPENYYNPIVKERPDVIILFDAVNFNGPVGEIGIFEKDDIQKVGFSTHNMSPRMLIDLILSEVKAEIIMIGAKPGDTSFGAEMGHHIKEAADTLADFLIRLIPEKEREVSD